MGRMPGAKRAPTARITQIAISDRPRVNLTAPLFGLYPQSDFRITDGRCRDCSTIPQALWYFENETVAVPRPGVPAATFARGLDAGADLRAWLASQGPGGSPERPQLVWIGAPQVLSGVRLNADASKAEGPGAP